MAEGAAASSGDATQVRRGAARDPWDADSSGNATQAPRRLSEMAPKADPVPKAEAAPAAPAKLEPVPAPKAAAAPTTPKKEAGDEKKPLPPGEVKAASPEKKPEKANKKGKGKGEGEGDGRTSVLPGTKILVKNLTEDTTADSIKKLCEEFGTVAGIDLKTNKDDGKCTGVAFVTFSTPEEATKAIGATDGKAVGDKTLQVQLVQRRERQPQADGEGNGKGKGKDQSQGKGKEKGAGTKGDKGKGKGKDGKGKKGVNPGAPQFTPQGHQVAANLQMQQAQQQLMAAATPYAPQQQQQQQQQHMNQRQQMQAAQMQQMQAAQAQQMQQYYYGYNYGQTLMQMQQYNYAAMVNQQYSGAPTPAAGAAGAAAAWPQGMQAQGAIAGPGPKEYDGVLKSVSQKNGFGFIHNEDLKQRYGGRDVYVDQNQLPPGAKVMDKVRFEVEETIKKKKAKDGGEEQHARVIAVKVQLLGSR